MYERLPHFIYNHWLLVAALVIIILALLIERLKNSSGGNSLSPSAAIQLINRERATVIDLRERDSYNSGHIVNAISQPQPDILNNLEKLKKYQDKPIILVCKQGQFAPGIAAKLRKTGFKQVYILTGGIVNWKETGLPLTK